MKLGHKPMKSRQYLVTLVLLVASFGCCADNFKFQGLEIGVTTKEQALSSLSKKYRPTTDPDGAIRVVGKLHQQTSGSMLLRFSSDKKLEEIRLTLPLKASKLAEKEITSGLHLDDHVTEASKGDSRLKVSSISEKERELIISSRTTSAREATQSNSFLNSISFELMLTCAGGLIIAFVIARRLFGHRRDLPLYQYAEKYIGDLNNTVISEVSRMNFGPTVQERILFMGNPRIKDEFFLTLQQKGKFNGGINASVKGAFKLYAKCAKENGEKAILALAMRFPSPRFRFFGILRDKSDTLYVFIADQDAYLNYHLNRCAELANYLIECGLAKDHGLRRQFNAGDFSSSMVTLEHICNLIDFRILCGQILRRKSNVDSSNRQSASSSKTLESAVTSGNTAAAAISSGVVVPEYMQQQVDSSHEMQPITNVSGTPMLSGTMIDIHGNPFGYDPGISNTSFDNTM